MKVYMKVGAVEPERRHPLPYRNPRPNDPAARTFSDRVSAVVEHGESGISRRRPTPDHCGR